VSGESRIDITIRRATRDDAEGMHTLHTASVVELCAAAYGEELLHDWISGRTPEGYHQGIDRGEMFVAERGVAGSAGVAERDVAERGTELLGFGHAIPGEVVAIFVDPRHAGRGVGARLLGHALIVARKHHDGAIILHATLNAVGFYERCGFVEVRRHEVVGRRVTVPVVEMHLDRTTDQVAVVPYRQGGDGLELCLITTVTKHRWAIPKGFIDPGETAIESALKEAREEAGLHGRIIGDPVGSYRYSKWGGTFTVDVYTMEVSRADESWDEAEMRARCWATTDEALRLLAGHPARDIVARAAGHLGNPSE
jgi:8-oxo-dGTP pyrophosphatase MutT (NUDIX family)/GNAT superfamily N-acetyltransferase